MPLVRIYQGRVTRTEWCDAASNPTEPAPELTDFSHPLWQHHALFQQAINYYLVAIAALANRKVESGVLTQLRLRVEAEWSGGDRRRGRVNGFGTSVSPLFGQPAHTAPEDLFPALLVGGPELAPARHLAGLLLLERCKGDAGIQQGGRGYWPRFCEPDTKPSYDFSPTALVGAAGKEQLAALIHTDEPSEIELRALAERLDLSWTVKVEPGKYFEGEDARGRLMAAVDHFSKQLESGPQARLDQWAAAHDGVAQLSRWREQIAALPVNGLRVPRNRKAAPGLTFSTLLFKLVPGPATAALLALHIKAPKKKGSAAQAETRPSSVDFAQLGDDPIKLARGTVGHVFRAFTSLRPWNPADSAKPQWSEFDIAAFKEALKTVNQFRLKTEERAARRSEIQALVDYQWARTDRAPASGDDDDDAPVRLGDDPRFIRLLTALEALARSDPDREGGYGLRRGGLRGWTELRDEWLRLQRSGANGDSGLYLQAVNEWQARHREGAGDPNLFRELAKPENHLIWQPVSTSEIEKHERAADVLRAACMLFEAEEELDQLEVPVRLTPADPVTSPRQFMFSDIKGRHAVKPGPKPGTWDVSIAARREASASIEATRIRLHVSAPRLRRDQLDAAAEGLLGRWLPPILEGALPEQAKELAPELAKPPALELMPDAVAGSPSPRIRRILVNLPVTLNVDRLASVGRSTFWQKQFNHVEDWPTHLLWPKMKGEPKESPWWSDPAGISILAIDLGQRAAAAAAVIEMRSDGRFSANRSPLPYSLGRTGDSEWRAAVISARLLRLPGEDRVLSQHERRPGQDLEEERSGQSGRLARAHEWDAALELARAFGETDPETRLGGKQDHASYPEHNDELLRLARAEANRLRRLQSYTWRLLDHEQSEATLTEIKDDKMLSDLIPADATPAAAADILAARFVRSREDYARNLEHLANRVAPLRNGAWRWAQQGQWHRLELWRLPEQSLDPLAEKAWLAGQRGLSMARIEQLEDLRRRFLSLNRLQAVEPKSKPLRPRREDPIPPEPCAELLEKIDRLKEQRINQTAQLILAEALGVRLRAHRLTPQERRERDIHGEYERIPGRRPIDVIVVEDLSRYRSSQDRARSENRRLMQWAHRAVTDKLRELAEPFGILVARVPAHYSSRFSARTGAVGFRATEVSAKDLTRFEWRQVKLRADAKQLRGDDECALRLMQAIEYVSEQPRARSDVPFTLLCPRDGGAMFVPLTGPTGPMQADVNAAINIGLRAVSAPDCTVARPRWRLEFISSKSSTPTLAPLPAAQRNKLETAFWSRAALRWIDGVANLEKDGRKRALLFTDPHRIASFDRGEITLDETALPATTSRGLFRAVKERRWARVFELSRQRLSKAGLLDETLSELLEEPGGSTQKHDNTSA